MLIMINRKLNSDEVKKKLKEELNKNKINGKLVLIDKESIIDENINHIPIKLKNILNSIPSDYIGEIHKELALLDLVLKGIEDKHKNYILELNWTNLLDLIVRNTDILKILSKSRPKDTNLFELCYFFKILTNNINDYFRIMGSNSELYNIKKEGKSIDILNIIFDDVLDTKTIKLLEQFKSLNKYEKNVEISLKDYIINDNFLNNNLFKLA